MGEPSAGAGAPCTLRLHLPGANLLSRPAWLRHGDHPSRSSRSLRGDELAPKLLYVEAVVSGDTQPQRTAAKAPVLEFATSLPTVAWGECLEFLLGGDIAVDGVLQLRLMERDVLEAGAAGAVGGRGSAPFEPQNGLLTCPDLTVEGSTFELGQRNMLHFTLAKHELRFFASKAEADKRSHPDDAPDGSFELAKASSVKISSKFTNCFELEMTERSGTHLQLFIAETHEVSFS